MLAEWEVRNIDCKQTRKWHIIIDGDNVPKTENVVVGVWICGSETYAELCFYDNDCKEWYSANPGTKGDAVNEPDYWIELPD